MPRQHTNRTQLKVPAISIRLLRVGSPRYSSGFCTAVARDVGSIIVGDSNPGACNPGFMLAPASQANMLSRGLLEFPFVLLHFDVVSESSEKGKDRSVERNSGKRGGK